MVILRRPVNTLEGDMNKEHCIRSRELHISLVTPPSSLTEPLLDPAIGYYVHKTNRVYHQMLLLQRYRLQRVQHPRHSQEILDKVDMNTTLEQTDLVFVASYTSITYILCNTTDSGKIRVFKRKFLEESTAPKEQLAHI